ncbi:hypothetical protein FVR03_05515 [Pontibacter qinzhouensis]|uniref:Carbonic anhydrase n=1 Tax=Pontibacter qinzhouensis TaxID=2603253 RepID=A0A5C8KE11_9BACT|nr:carbonic anhydrase [Pontibacter qinzhouensis]TXK50060.1 hypothetical protein FVR03_05515 [Pontibacter qinzhouensis]
MKNRLFLICPASQTESLIKEQYGQEVFFLTALGAVFNFQEINYVETLEDFLKREAIDEVIIVSDSSCPFIKSVLEQEKGFDTKAEQVLRDLLVDNYATVMAGDSLADKKKNMAKLNIQRQADDILSNELLLSPITQSQIRIKGLVTTKEKGQLEEVKLTLKELNQ